MTILRLFSITFLAFLLASCSSSNISMDEENTVVEKDKKTNKEEEEARISAKESLGIGTWRDISRSEAKVSIMDGEEKIQFRKGLIFLDDPAAYAEILVFKEGTIFFKRDKNQIAIPSMKGEEQWKNKLREIVKKNEELKSLQINIDNYQKHEENNTLMVSTTGDLGNKHCHVFYKALIDKQINNDNKENKNDDTTVALENNTENTVAKKSQLAQRASGVFCFDKNDRNLEAKKQKLLTIAKNITFDSGSHAQAHTLAALTKNLDDFWSKQDAEPPKIEITQGSFDKNKKLVFIRGTVTDNENKIGFIKVNGQRLKDDDFKSVLDKQGNFTIYVRSERDFDSATLTIGDQYGNIATEILKEGTVTAANNNPIVFKKAGTGKTYVLLAGVGNYKIPKLLAPLTSPTYDVSLLKRTLVSTLGVPESQIITLNNPQKEEFITTLETLKKDTMTYGDQLLLYFSGHGTVSEQTKSGYWAFSDTTDKPKTWLANVELKNRLAGFSDGGIMLIADSCFSGNLIADNFSIDVKMNDIDINNSPQSRTALTSAGNNPVPDTGNQLNSAFALAITNSLKWGSSLDVVKKRKIIPAFAIYNQTRKKLTDSGQRTPNYGSLYKSDLKKDFVIKVN